MPGWREGWVLFHDKNDWMNSVATGLRIGVLFRVASRLRFAAVAGAIRRLMVGATVAVKQVFNRYVPI